MKINTLILVILVAVLLTQFYAKVPALLVKTGSPNDDWPMFLHDPAHTGYSSGASPAISAVQLWNYSTGFAVWSSPALAAGRVYVRCWDNNIYCLNASTGEKVWSASTGEKTWGYTIESPVQYSSPAVVDGFV
jgi:hypothetical protein